MPQANSTHRRAFRGRSFRQLLKADRQRRFRPLRLEQLEGRQMLTLTLSIAVTDGTMTEPPYNDPYDPMAAPDKGSYTITRSGEDMSEPLMVPLWVSVTQVGGDAFSYDPNNGYYDPNYGIYNCVSQCAIIPANEDSVTIYTIPSQDGDYEPTESFEVSIDVDGVTPDEWVLSPAEATFTLYDNSPHLDVTADGPASESNPTAKHFVVTKSNYGEAGSGALSFSYTLSGTASRPADYSISGSATIPAGQTSTTLTVTPVNDCLYEPNGETVIFTINNQYGDDFEATTPSATITIQDDDAPTPLLNIGDWSGTESGNASFPVTLSCSSTQTITVQYATNDGTAVHPADYSQTSGTLTFAPNQTSKTISVTITPDSLDEDDETFNVNLTNATNATIADGQGVGTIIDNDPTPSLSISDATVNENAGYATFTVSLSAVSGRTVEVNYNTSDGTATHGADYTTTGSTLSFAPGQTTKTIAVPIINDAVDETSETYSVILHDAFNAAIADGTGLGTIVDNKPTIAITADAKDIMENGGTAGKFIFTRSGAGDMNQSLTVTYSVATGGNNAMPGTDYQSLSNTVNFSAGQMTVTVTVTPVNDKAPEVDETVIASLPASINYHLDSGHSTATVTIRDDDKNSSQEKSCNCDCPTPTCGVDKATGDERVKAAGIPASPMTTLGSTPTVDEVNRPRANPHPIVGIDVQFDQHATSAISIEAQIDFGGIEGDPVFYDPSTLTANTLYHFAFMAAATTLASGSYEWQITVTEHYTGDPDVVRTYNGRQEIANLVNSEYGNRWTNTQLDRLEIQEGGVALIQGSGNYSWFAETSPGVFGREAGEMGQSTLTFDDGPDEYTLSTKYSYSSVFNAAGMLIKRIDVAGNETTYTYIDADNDSVADELETIVDPSGLTTTYGYTDGLVATVTDYAGRITSFDYDQNGHLLSVTRPDPDAGGPLQPSVSSFTYDETTGLVTTVTDPDGHAVTLEYRTDRTVKKRIYEDDSFEEFAPSLNAGVVDTTEGLGSENDPAPLVVTANIKGSHKNELGKIDYFTSDRFGALLTETDPLSHTTTYSRNSEGLATSITGPDPDGGGPLTAPVTSYTYDALGNVTHISYPDGSGESWTYNQNFSQPTSYTDPRGKVTLYTLDSNTGLTTAMRQVVGAVDGVGNTETNDLVTTFTYTAAPVNQGDPPAGLVATITDPLSRVTHNHYDEHGDLTSVTYAVGTAEEASISMEYDDASNMTALVDELGRRTEYAYDQLDRLITMTLPDPDGNGPLASPVYHYQYNGRDLKTKEIDPLGRETSYDYSDRGDLISITRPDNDGDENLTVTTLAYDVARHLTSLTDPLGRVTTFGYDDAGRRTSTTLPDPDGAGPLAAPVYQTVYDNLSRVTQSIDPLNHTTSYAYVNFGRQVTSTLPGGSTGTVVYDAAGNLTSSTDARGAVTTYAYDDLGRLTTVTEPDPDGAGALSSPVTTYAYDKASNLRFVTDPLGNVTQYVYDHRDRLIQTILPDPDGAGALSAPTIAYAYDDAGQLLSVTDPLLRVTSYQYDAIGRLILVTQPDPDGSGPLASPQIAYAYDAASRLISVTDPLGSVTAYEYDALDNLITVTQEDPDGAGPLSAPVTHFVYDAASQLLSVTDPEGRTTTYGYDALGRRTTVTLADPDSAGPLAAPVTTYGYDAAGNLLLVTDPLLHETAYEYDNVNRRTKITDAESGETSFTYDATGNLLTLTDPDDNTTTWTYDKLGRVTAETNELNKSRTFKYDADGNLTERVDRLGRKIAWNYDHLNRNTDEKWYDGNTLVRTLSYTYDAAGQLTQGTDPAGTLGYSYDRLGRVASESQSFAGFSPLITYDRTFDAAGNVTDLKTAVAGTADFENTYAYDALSRLKSVRQHGQVGGNAVAEKRADFTYNAAGQFASISRYADVAGSDHVASSFYSYDGIGRLSKLTHNDGSPPLPLGEGWGEGDLAGYEFTYDAASRITAINSLQDDLSQYSYDQTSQLTSADHASQADESYSYDANGNRAGGNYGVGANNRLLGDGTYSYAYDDEGNRIRRTDLATGSYTTYSWDFRNRLIGVYDRGPEASGGQGTAWGWGETSGSGTNVDPNAEDGEGTAWGWGETTGSGINFDPEADDGEGTAWGWGEWAGGASVQVNDDPEEWDGYWAQILDFGAAVSEGNDVVVQVWSDDGGSTFEYWVEDVSATAGADYSGDLIDPNNTWIAVPNSGYTELIFPTTDDAEVETRESFKIHFRSQWHPELETEIEADILDNDAHTFTAEVAAGTEGGNVVLTVSADSPAEFEYWVEDVSAALGTDYWVEPDEIAITSGTFSTDAYGDAAIDLPTIDNDSLQTTRSFKLHVRIAGSELGEVILEADILDNDAHTFDATAPFQYEGSNLDLFVFTDGPLDFEYWVEDVSAVPGADYLVDPNDVQVTSGTFSTDVNGFALISFPTIDNQLDQATRSFQIHLRLVGSEYSELILEADIHDNDLPGISQAVTYAYDFTDHLIRRTLDPDGDGEQDPTDTFFSWLDNQIALQFGGSVASDLSHRYFWNPAATDQIFADESVTDLATPGSVLYPLTDHLGTPRDLAQHDAIEDATTIVNHRVYDTFGKLTSQTDDGFSIAFGFTGVYLDIATSLYYHRERWYDTTIGRWVSEDPSGFFLASDSNLGRLVHNSPVNFTDPSGLEESGGPVRMAGAMAAAYAQSMWSAPWDLGAGAWSFARETGYYFRDVGAIAVDIPFSYYNNSLGVEEWSSVGKNNKPNDPNFWSNAAENAGRAGAAAGTLGAEPMILNSIEFCQDGDGSKLRRGNGAAAAANLAAAAAIKAGQARAAAESPARSLPYRAGKMVRDLMTDEDGSAGARETPYRDPQRPSYNNGTTQMDHEDARVWGNTGEANRPLPAETNMRRGGFDGQLRQQYYDLVDDLRRSGIPRGQAERMARQAVQSEIDANKNSPPPRLMDPHELDKLPENPCDQPR